uniref:Uncharacterized protein n=1 Tax=Siphoviridae sp. ctvI513 TaxID=2827965 RepID=A0A8S5TJ80_9CAUD|nr:MAG TPA: hypothetical protein [Siphoviridae sp. ctvI513]
MYYKLQYRIVKNHLLYKEKWYTIITRKGGEQT